MFVSEKKLKKSIEEVLKNPDSTISLKEKITKLKEDIADLEFKKGLEEKEIKHLVKMKEEKNALEQAKKYVELEKDFQKKEMEMQTKYHEQSVELIEKGHKKMEDIYGKIMERLPNVNLELNRKKK